MLCFSSGDGRHPIKRWSGNDIWLNAPGLTLPACTLTVMGNVRALQSQPADQPGEMGIFVQLVLMVKKMYSLVFFLSMFFSTLKTKGDYCFKEQNLRRY